MSAAVLELGGYIAGQAQSAQALRAIRVNFIFLPAIVGAVCAALFPLYHLDQDYPCVHAALEIKRAGAQKGDHKKG